MLSDDSTGRRFYARWARLYDALVWAVPLRRHRARIVDQLNLEAGDTVVEVGCGPGANLPLLADAVGPTGRVIGIDVARPTLAVARRVADRRPAVTLVHADARSPPVAGPVDAVLGTFVAGLFADPVTVVDRWVRRLSADGSIVLAHLTRSDRPLGRLAGPPYRLLVVLSLAPLWRLSYPGDPVGRHDARVAAAHERVKAATARGSDTHRLAGLLRVTAGHRPISTASKSG